MLLFQSGAFFFRSAGGSVSFLSFAQYHELGSLLVTWNGALAQWTTLFGDARLTAAFAHRPTQHRLINEFYITGEGKTLENLIPSYAYGSAIVIEYFSAYASDALTL